MYAQFPMIVYIERLEENPLPKQGVHGHLYSL